MGAIHAELRAEMARRGIGQRELEAHLDGEIAASEGWLSKRLNGRVPWRLVDLLTVLGVIGVDDPGEWIGRALGAGNHRAVPVDWLRSFIRNESRAAAEEAAADQGNKEEDTGGEQ